MKVATGRIVEGAVITRTRFPEGARVRIVLEDARAAVVLDPNEEAGVLKGLREFAEGRGKPISRQRSRIRKRLRGRGRTR